VVKKPKKKKQATPRCPYCGSAATFHENSARFYHGHDYGPVWACVSCQAWVGCHPNTHRPLGRLADAELRKAKIAAHAAFDPLWQEKYRRRLIERGPDYKKFYARGSGYKWLAFQLGIDKKQCHIGLFDVETCRRVVEVCTDPSKRKPYEKSTPPIDAEAQP
jgi:hypothetical protein